MADSNVSDKNNESNDTPVPELLKTQSDDDSSSPTQENIEKAAPSTPKQKLSAKLRHGNFRPSHKATFIGLAVVVGILAINAGIIYFVMNSQNESNKETNRDSVTISPAVLSKLGVNRSTVGKSGAELVVGPDATFNGKVKISDDVSIGGQLNINGKLSVNDASFVKMSAGDTTLSQLNVNGDATVTNLNLRKDLAVVGSSRLQGPVTVSQLLTVNNSVNISGSLSVGGTLSIGGLQANLLTVGGHIVTVGSSPSVSKGSGLGSLDTVSISGNDIAGTIAVNIGSVARSGVVANVTFTNSYSSTPHVIITSVGPGASNIYVNRSSTGFSIGVSSISAASGHAFDYVVMQ